MFLKNMPQKRDGALPQESDRCTRTTGEHLGRLSIEISPRLSKSVRARHFDCRLIPSLLSMPFASLIGSPAFFQFR
jgi:hypothetical protein